MSGYPQQAAADLLVDYREREDRLESHPGRGGLAACAVLLDLERGLKRVEKSGGHRAEEILARASEWIDGIDFDRHADPSKLPETTFQPLLVVDIPELQTAIREAHDAESHLVMWQGRWTSALTLLRMLDDTRAVRRIAGAMSNKRKREPFLILAGPAHRGECSVCGVWLADIVIYRLRHPDQRWCIAHGAAPLAVVSSLT